MRLAIKILFIISSLISLYLLSEIWEPLPTSTVAYSKDLILKKDVSIDFEVQLDGCYKIELIPFFGSILGNDYNIKTQLNPTTESQVINSEIEIRDGKFQLGSFCANQGDDFELKMSINDDRLLLKKVRLLIDANDAMPSQNLMWATELRPLIKKLFYFFLGLTLIIGTLLIFVKKKSV